MKFKHSFNVLIDNFAVTYKLLVYKLVIVVITCFLYAAIITPFVQALTKSPDFISLKEGVKEFFKILVRGEANIGNATMQIEKAFNALLSLIEQNSGNIILGIVALILVHTVEKFFTGLGNYAMAAIINDKMSLRANSPFIITLIKNLKMSSVYSAIYAPLSVLYDVIFYSGVFILIFNVLALVHMISVFLKIFLFITFIIVLVSLKMTFTSDWLPSLIRGKMKQGKAMKYTLSRRNKNTFNVLSNFLVITLFIITVNIGAAICTLGTALLLTVPSSYAILICFEFVNYYDREELKYFIDKNTIIKPEKETVLTREDFFKGK